jgi:phage-related minor tail protein
LAGALASFETGGYTGAGGRMTPAGVVHKGEFVMPADVVAKRGPGYFYALMDSLRFERPMPALAGYATGGLVGMNAPAAEGVRVEANRPTQNRFNIGLFNDPAALQRWAQSQEGETVILDVLRRNRHEFQA